MNRRDQQLMKQYGILSSISKVRYHFGGCAFDRLDDAVLHAKIVLEGSSEVIQLPADKLAR